VLQNALNAPDGELPGLVWVPMQAQYARRQCLGRPGGHNDARLLG
jgi:hypothetical protein